MQAAILSGGLGTRLRSVESNLPKTMVGVTGKPFLEHILNMLVRRGLSDFVLMLSYKSDMIVDFLRDLRTREKGIRIRWTVEPSPLGTGGALVYAGNVLEDCFFVINGDSFLDMDYITMAEVFIGSDFDAMMAVYDNRDDTGVPKNVAVGRNGLVKDYRKESGDPDMTHVDAGVLLLRRSVLDGMPRGQACSLEHDVYPRLIKGGRFGSFQVEQRFYDIGTPERLKRFEEMIRSASR